MEQIQRVIAEALNEVAAGRPVIVLSTHEQDAPVWEQLLVNAGTDHLVLALGREFTPGRQISGPSAHLEFHHEVVARLVLGPSRLDDFDPVNRAVMIIPDPLLPPLIGGRAQLGRRRPEWALVEDKMLIDPLWDLAGIDRVPALTCDSTHAVARLADEVNEGRGVVASCQHRGHGPRAGAEGIWWWQNVPPQAFPSQAHDLRVRLMPLLEGLPCRVHGIVTAEGIAAFPPMELLSLPRPSTGTFLWAGAVPLGEHPRSGELRQITESAGAFLRDRFGYRGSFASDGILTTDGYRPTELTTRLTSAFETVPSQVRVLLHAATVLARAGFSLPDLGPLVSTALTSDVVTVFGASAHADSAPFECGVVWDGTRWLTNDGTGQGTLTVRPWVRGWQLRADLRRADLPAGIPIGMVAPHLFHLADSQFGTSFGEVTAPFGLTLPSARCP
ncbi:hypothetical protein LO762_25395 [Actinocorallia sp. API 0066]|uniref:hypothetical protein n=1 Tax=Actinocorallia sp. API 0066 TaxID=2896846 RepID=UPI001E5CFC4B|nr:hypothetical protein [Actinocorallia sp. API 0066]MCD0452494.1 hypothetical protein [Actinocorallia sp. API 0066]